MCRFLLYKKTGFRRRLAFICIHLRGCTALSLLPCGRGDRVRWRMENLVAHESALHTCVRPNMQPRHKRLRRKKASFHVEGGGPLAVEDRELGDLVRLPCILACALRCTALPISRTRRLSPTAIAVPPLSVKEGFCVHHSLLSCMSKSLRDCTFPSLLPCGRRGTACGGG